MSRNPVEDNFVTRFVLGGVVIAGTMIGGEIAGTAFDPLDFPYSGLVGVTIGAVLAFVAFSAVYRRYDAPHNADQ